MVAISCLYPWDIITPLNTGVNPDFQCGNTGRDCAEPPQKRDLHPKTPHPKILTSQFNQLQLRLILKRRVQILTTRTSVNAEMLVPSI